MTHPLPPSLATIVKAEAEKYCDREQWHDNDCGTFAVLKMSFKEGAQFLFAHLAEPGEACGPRRFAGQGNSECSDTYATLAPLFPTDTAYVPEALLLQARAARELELADIQRDGEQMIAQISTAMQKVVIERDAERAALASSEARVRILSEALEEIAKPTYGTELGMDDKEFFASITEHWKRYQRIARQALLEVQR